MGVFKLGGMTLASLFKKAPTRRYPHEVREPYPRTRGQVEMTDMKGCILCSLCVRKCPANCIEVSKEDETWTYWPYKCVACDSCVAACPKNVLAMSNVRPPVATDLSFVQHKKPPLTPEELAEKERKEAEKKAKIQAALAAKKAKEEAARKASEEQGASSGPDAEEG